MIPPSHQTKIYFSAPVNKDPLTSLDYIRKIVEFCRQENINLKILLTPSHAHQLEISAATGEWPSIENGKRALVKILADDAARHPDKQSFPLFDFSRYSNITMEPLPAAGTHEEMKFYWDSSHFKDNVGDVVLDQLLNNSSQNRSIPDNFGVLLTADNIEGSLIQTREAQTLYRKQHPEDIKTIQTLVDDFKRENNISDQDH